MRVLVRNKREQGGPGKIRSHWEQKIYKVVGELTENVLYKVKSDDAKAEVRVLHRNLLLPCNEMDELDSTVEPSTRIKRKTRSASEPMSGQEESDSEDEQETYASCTQRLRTSIECKLVEE